jgi:hypothetical protein
MNSQPLVHIHVPAGRNKPRTKKSRIPPRLEWHSEIH